MGFVEGTRNSDLHIQGLVRVGLTVKGHVKKYYDAFDRWRVAVAPAAT
jgi:hypothetical protein